MPKSWEQRRFDLIWFVRPWKKIKMTGKRRESDDRLVGAEWNRKESQERAIKEKFMRTIDSLRKTLQTKMLAFVARWRLTHRTTHTYCWNPELQWYQPNKWLQSSSPYRQCSWVFHLGPCTSDLGRDQTGSPPLGLPPWLWLGPPPIRYASAATNTPFSVRIKWNCWNSVREPFYYQTVKGGLVEFEITVRYGVKWGEVRTVVFGGVAVRVFLFPFSTRLTLRYVMWLAAASFVHGCSCRTDCAPADRRLFSLQAAKKECNTRMVRTSTTSRIQSTSSRSIGKWELWIIYYQLSK